MLSSRHDAWSGVNSMPYCCWTVSMSCCTNGPGVAPDSVVGTPGTVGTTGSDAPAAAALTATSPVSRPLSVNPHPCRIASASLSSPGEMADSKPSSMHLAVAGSTPSIASTAAAATGSTAPGTVGTAPNTVVATPGTVGVAPATRSIGLIPHCVIRSMIAVMSCRSTFVALPIRHVICSGVRPRLSRLNGTVVGVATSPPPPDSVAPADAANPDRQDGCGQDGCDQSRAHSRNLALTSGARCRVTG